MTLAPGHKIASYEIVEPIGAGGMGQVYRARDTRLDRDVAVKVLPESLAEDPERLARFEREAKLLAALNHPGIATLHGLENADGQPVLVMELVDGETLAERIARGPLALGEALALFAQIADALGAAHAKGIVHRDLKPANVKLTPDGNVKVLDFGLAKLAEPDTASSDTGASQSPTLTKNTALGAILGTASYMSPEQARGKQVDKRTDIWAFGCCLFEAITGRKAFDGETVADVLSKVLQSEPEWSALPATMRKLVHRCLDKDPDRRFHDIADVGFEMEESAARPPALESPPSTRWLFAAIVLAALAGGLATWFSTRPATLDVRRLAITLPDGDSFIVGGIEGPLVTISPDGDQVVYAGVRDGVEQLFVRHLDRETAEPLPGTLNGRAPFFSANGEWIGFYQGQALVKVALVGGPPMSLTPLTSANPIGGSWSHGGQIVFGQWESGLSWMDEDGGDAANAPLDEAAREIAQHWPYVLPDGDTVLFASVRGGYNEPPSITVLSLETGGTRVLVEHGSFPRYVQSGHLLFARDDTVLAAPFDAERAELTGPPVPVLSDVGRGGSGEAYFDVSNDGTLVYVSGQTKPMAGLVWVDRHGRSEPVGPRRRASWHSPRVSPSGELVAAVLEPQAGLPDIWLIETALASSTRLTSTGALEPIWTPDGDALFYQWSARVMRQDIALSGDRDNLEYCLGLKSVTRDGKTALCTDRTEAGDHDIDLVRLDGSGDTTKLLSSSFDESSPKLSPDERWMAFVSDESGQPEVYVQPFPGPGRKQRVSSQGGAEPAWSRDGRELFYRNKLDMYRVPFSTNGAEGEPTLLFSGDFGTNAALFDTHYDVSPDGQHFLMIENEPSDVRPEIHVVLNWHQELKRLAP